MIRYVSFLAPSIKGSILTSRETLCTDPLQTALCTWYCQGRLVSTMCLRPPGLPSDMPPADELPQDHLNITNWRVFFFFFYFLFLQSHTLGGRNLELSKIGCVPVFRPVPYPPLWKSLMVKKTLSHIIRSTRKMALVQFLKGKSFTFPKHIWLHHFLNGNSPSIRVISNESTLHMRWPKYWSFSFSISPSNEHPGQISCRMDWLDFPCSPRDSQESSPAPLFKSISYSTLSFIYSPTLTSIHD